MKIILFLILSSILSIVLQFWITGKVENLIQFYFSKLIKNYLLLVHPLVAPLHGLSSKCANKIIVR